MGQLCEKPAMATFELISSLGGEFEQIDEDDIDYVTMVIQDSKYQAYRLHAKAIVGYLCRLLFLFLNL